MNVSLTPELEQVIKEKLDSGLYASASEVVREALRNMFANNEREKIRALRDAAITEGIAAADRGEKRELTREVWNDMMTEADAADPDEALDPMVTGDY